jgi:dTDP-4-amino-4,6-dideoxy-D-galactose acyltransferase
MSAQTGNQLCSRLDWDSSFWGFEIARLNPNKLSERDVRNAIRWCEDRKVCCLYFSADGTDGETLGLAAREGFGYVDTRVDMETSAFARRNGTVGVGLFFREAVADDLPTLFHIARGAYTDTRFFKDSRFAKVRAADLYEKWIERDFAEHTVLIASESDSSGPVLGYITCQSEDEDRGRIGLVGVAETARNRGVGSCLVEAGLQHFRNSGKSTVRVATQGTNIAAMRLYESAGFKTKQVSIWFHRWFEPITSNNPVKS